MLNHTLKSEPNTPLPAAYAMVFYHGKQSPYPYSLKLEDCFNDPLGLMRKVLSDAVPLIDVNQLSDEALKQQSWVGPMARALKHIRDRDLTDILLELLEDIQQLESDDGNQLLEFVRTLLNYMLYTGNIGDVGGFLEQGHDRLAAPIRSEFMTIADKLKALGAQEGREEGRQEGESSTKETVAVRLLREGTEPQFVVKVTDLSLKEVLRLQKTI
jgi:predicted transposase YdaD